MSTKMSSIFLLSSKCFITILGLNYYKSGSQLCRLFNDMDATNKLIILGRTVHQGSG